MGHWAFQVVLLGFSCCFSFSFDLLHGPEVDTSGGGFFDFDRGFLSPFRWTLTQERCKLMVL